MTVEQLDSLVNITLGVGSVLTMLVSIVAVIAWRIGRGLSNRDQQVKDVVSRLDAHEKECIDFREKVATRFKEGSEHFTHIERSLGRIEGAVNSPVKQGVERQ